MDTERRAHILQVGADSSIDQLTQQRGRALFNGQTEAGRTDHVIVYTDGSPAGDATAQAVLATAEADYLATAAFFGGLTLPPGQEGDDQTVPRTATPVQVLIDAQAGGAYHFGCNATDLYLEPTPELASGFFVAELVEVFEAAIANGWDCGQTNGEGLSRVLAGERNPNLGSLFVQTEQAWWADGHADYTSDNSADDTNQDANGCATLFLSYLHSQLGYDWTSIVTSGGGTLGETYTRLSGQDGAAGFNDFITQLSTLDVGGFLNVPASGNPFPIGAAGAPAQSQTGTEQGQPAPDGAAEGSAEDVAAAAGTPMAEGAMAEGAMAEGAMASAAEAGTPTPEGAMPVDTVPGGVDVVESYVEVYEAAPVGDAAGTDQPVYAIYETAVETQYPLSAGAEMSSSDSGDDGQTVPADDQTMSADDQTMPDDGRTVVDDGQTVVDDDQTMPDMPTQNVADAPADDLMPDEVADEVAEVAVLDRPAQTAPRELDVLEPIPPIPEPTVHALPEMPVAEMPVAEMPVAPETPATSPTPYIEVAAAPQRVDAVETMIGVLVVLIVLVLLALLTVLFAGGIIHV